MLLLTFLNCVQIAINYKNLEIQPTCEVLVCFSFFLGQDESSHGLFLCNNVPFYLQKKYQFYCSCWCWVSPYSFFTAIKTTKVTEYSNLSSFCIGTTRKQLRCAYSYSLQEVCSSMTYDVGGSRVCAWVCEKLYCELCLDAARWPAHPLRVWAYLCVPAQLPIYLVEAAFEKKMCSSLSLRSNPL